MAAHSNPYGRNNNIRAGWFIYAQGLTYQIAEIRTDSQSVIAENLHTQDRTEFSLDDLFGSASEGVFVAPTREGLQMLLETIQPAAPPVYRDNTLPDSFLKQAEHIIFVVERVAELLKTYERDAVKRGKPPVKQTEALKWALRQLDTRVGITTYYKYKKNYQTHNGIASRIAADMRRSTYNKTKMSSAQLHLVDAITVTYFLRPHQMRISKVYILLLETLKRTGNMWVDPDKCRAGVPQNLVEDLLNPAIPMTAILNNPNNRLLLSEVEIPSERWFYGYMKHFEDSHRELSQHRYGKEFAERRDAVFDTFITKAQRPLQLVFADHWLTDMFILGDDKRPFRMWLTLLIDVYTRSVLGMALLEESPSIESIQTALLNAIWPKRSHKELGIEEDWVAYGIPETLSLDNAWAHHSYSMEELCRSIGLGNKFTTIQLDFRPPYKAQHGAVIERLFGNFSSVMKQIAKGAIRSSHPKDVRQAAQEAVHTEADLRLLIHEQIVRYQHTPHSALNGMTPHEKWIEATQTFGFPQVPKLTPEIERYFWRLSPDTRVITSKGISAFGMHYWSDELTVAQRHDITGKKVEYSFRYNLDDIGRLALFRDGTWIGDVEAKELRLPDGTILRLSMADRKIAQEAAKSAGRASANWLPFIREWTNLEEQREKEKKQGKNRKADGRIIPFEASRTQANSKPAMVRNTTNDEETDVLAKFLQNPRR